MTAQDEAWATRSGVRTDPGVVRSANEDAHLVRPPFFAVADGLGGHAAGNVASGIVISTITTLLDAHPPSADVDLRELLIVANARLRSRAAEDIALAGMGSTCTLAKIGGKLEIAHVGDTRAYLLRDGSLQRLTTDHTLVAQLVSAGHVSAENARSELNRHVLMRALGTAEDVEVDLVRHDLRTGDRLLLCSDGLTGMLRDAQLGDLLLELDDPQAAADGLVDAANLCGGEDNVTALVVDIVPA